MGDDIVIADQGVAKAYLEIMTEWFGVEINLSKSIQSKLGMMEFAKRIVTPESEFSPVGPKNIILSLKAPANIPTLIDDYIKKGGCIDFASVVQAVGMLTHDIVKISRGKMETLL